MSPFHTTNPKRITKNNSKLPLSNQLFVFDMTKGSKLEIECLLLVWPKAPMHNYMFTIGVTNGSNSQLHV